jgi:hypothetical protein
MKKYKQKKYCRIFVTNSVEKTSLTQLKPKMRKEQNAGTQLKLQRPNFYNFWTDYRHLADGYRGPLSSRQ